MVRGFLAVLMGVAAVMVGPIQQAGAHAVACSNDAQEPFFNRNPAPGRAHVQGATIIECSPTAPDAQRTEVQLQWENPTWVNRGSPYVSYSNAQFHRVYDSTTCIVGDYDVWRTKAKHTGTHGNAVTNVDYSYLNSFYCPHN